MENEEWGINEARSAISAQMLTPELTGTSLYHRTKHCILFCKASLLGYLLDHLLAHTVFSVCVCVCVCVQISLSYKDTSHIGLEVTQ